MLAPPSVTGFGHLNCRQRVTSESQCKSYAANGGTVLTSPPPTRILTVSKSGSGTGTVTGADISCGSDCTEDHVNGTSVTLTATADTGSTFTGWSGDCSGTTCTLSMTSNKTAVANFDADTTLPPFTAPNIYLGYADTFFDSTGPTVPTPWAGDPNIVFVGCTTEESAASTTLAPS